MRKLRIKREPEIIYLPPSNSIQSTTYLDIAFILVCCLSVASIASNLLTLLS